MMPTFHMAPEYFQQESQEENGNTSKQRNRIKQSNERLQRIKDQLKQMNQQYKVNINENTIYLSIQEQSIRINKQIANFIKNTDNKVIHYKESLCQAHLKLKKRKKRIQENLIHNTNKINSLQKHIDSFQNIMLNYPWQHNFEQEEFQRVALALEQNINDEHQKFEMKKKNIMEQMNQFNQLVREAKKNINSKKQLEEIILKMLRELKQQIENEKQDKTTEKIEAEIQNMRQQIKIQIQKECMERQERKEQLLLCFENTLEEILKCKDC